MKKLIVLRGNSGSGKTTVAKELQKKFGKNTMLISQDVVRRDILNAKEGENTIALSLLKELLFYGYRNCEIVILEGILNSICYCSLFKLAVELYGMNLYSYYFDLPFEETLKRHKTKPNCYEFGENELRKWWVNKDLSSILNENMITKERNKESIINEIYNSVKF